MTTQDLANVIATESGLTNIQADKALSALAANVANALRNNEEVYLAGLGTFTTSRIPKEMEGSSIASGSTQVETTRVPHFEPGKELLNAIR